MLPEDFGCVQLSADLPHKPPMLRNPRFAQRLHSDSYSGLLPSASSGQIISAFSCISISVFVGKLKS